jgi:hypothetical protein
MTVYAVLHSEHMNRGLLLKAACEYVANGGEGWKVTL